MCEWVSKQSSDLKKIYRAGTAPPGSSIPWSATALPYQRTSLTSWCLQFSLTPEYVLLQSLLWNVNCQSYTVVDTCTCTLYIYMLNKKHCMHWCTHQIYGPKKFPREHHCFHKQNVKRVFSIFIGQCENNRRVPRRSFVKNRAKIYKQKKCLNLRHRGVAKNDMTSYLETAV